MYTPTSSSKLPSALSVTTMCH